VALRLLVAHSAAEREAAREVEARVFLQAFGNTPEVMEQEYGPYGHRSRFVTVLDDATGDALGAARLILPDDTGPVKTLVDVAGEPWRLSVADSLRSAGLSGRPVWDVASLAVDRRYRSGAAGAEVTLALCHGLFRYSWNCGAEGLVTILDDRVLRVLRVMGVPWTPMAGASSRFYLGSPASTPCVCLVGAIADSIRERRPDLAPAVVDGTFRSIGLDPADLEPDRGGALPEGRGGSRAGVARDLDRQVDTCL
jgi:hypothetical protein